MTPTLRSLPVPPPPAALPTSLPPLPRPTPVRETLWRGPGTLQFGVHPAGALVLEGLTPPLARMVADLDGARRGVDVVADAVAAGADPAAACAVLAGMHAAGLLAGSAPERARLGPDAAALAVGSTRPGADARVVLGARARACVVVHGAGRVGVALACLLAGSGVGRIHIVAEGLVLGLDTGTGLAESDVGLPRGTAAAEAVARAAPGTPVTTASRAGALAAVRRHDADLVVLADTAVADPLLVVGLVEDRRTHLPVGVRDGLGVIGPLVLPGRSGCLRCEELERGDADPAWPNLAAQLASRVPVVGVAAATATAAVAAGQVLAVLDGTAGPTARPGAAPAVLEAVLELDVGSGSLRRRILAPHPGCSCRPWLPSAPDVSVVA